MTATMLDRVAVEALLPPEDAPGLRLDRDRLGVGRLGTRALTEPQWTTVMPEARDAHIVRGGSRDGATVAAEVGTLTVTGLDSEVLQRVRPSTPVRVRRLRDPHGGYGGDPSAADYLFTGRALDLHTAWQRSADDLATITAVTTLTAVDAVHQLANTQRYGAVITYAHGWDNMETLGQRAQRLLAPTGLAWSGPGSHRVNWGDGPEWNTPGTYGQASRRDPDEDGPGWVGFRYEPGEPYNGPRVQYRIPHPDAPAGAVITAALWVRVHHRSGGPTPLEAQVNLAGVPTIVTLPEDGSWHLIEVRAPRLAGSQSYLSVRSTAAGSPTGTAANMAGMDVTGVVYSIDGPGCLGAGYQLGSLVYESTLVNHLDVAVNSTRGAWWVDAAGTVQVRACRHGADTPPLLLSDEPGAAFSYVGLSHSLDTARIVNDLTLENHGRQPDPDRPGTFIADDRNLGPYRDWTSVATNGYRAGSVSTGLAYPDPRVPMLQDAPHRLATEYLATASAATPFPSLVRLYRDPSDPPLPSLDVMSPVDVRFRGQTYPCLVAGLEHEITPRRWHTTLTLVER